MSSYCEDCGCKVYSGACINCHEEIYIADQYRALKKPVPESIQKKEAEHINQISRRSK